MEERVGRGVIDLIKNKSIIWLANLAYPDATISAVEQTKNDTHNTKVILSFSHGADRVVFYNRIDIGLLLKNVSVQETNLSDLIYGLNAKGYDFNENDLEFIGDILCAKSTSLGYVGSHPITRDDTSVKNLKVESDEMSKLKLSWASKLLEGHTQEIEKKVGDAEWLFISLTVTEDSVGSGTWTAEDTDIVFDEETIVEYRIVVFNGVLRTSGNVVSCTVPSAVVAVTDLSIELIND